jgi:hypothetical protein
LGRLKIRLRFEGVKSDADKPNFPCLLPNNLHKHSFSSATIELTVKDLFPRPKIELSFGNGNDHFPPHNLPFQMRIGIVFPRAVVVIAVDRLMRSQLFEPDLEIMVETSLVVVYEDGGSYMHGIYKTDAFLNSALSDAFLYRLRYIYESPTVWHLKPQLFGQ